jgi:hypothetical protein
MSRPRKERKKQICLRQQKNKDEKINARGRVNA